MTYLYKAISLIFCNLIPVLLLFVYKASIRMPSVSQPAVTITILRYVKTGRVTGVYQVRIHVAPPFSTPSLLLVRSSLSWHYPNSPKNSKTVLNPRHDWLHHGSGLKKDPFHIWLYPQLCGITQQKDPFAAIYCSGRIGHSQAK